MSGLIVACWKCVSRSVVNPGEMCDTCAASDDRKSRRYATSVVAEKTEESSDRAYYRHNVSSDTEAVEVRFQSDIDMPRANAKPADWMQYQAEKTSTLTGGFDPLDLL